MTRHPLTIAPDVNIQDALIRMNKDRVRRYPVVDNKGRLVGIVSHSDLMNASPSDATSLSVWEVNYLLSKIQVKDVMTKEIITVTEDMPIEEAARIMANNKIGGLPVVADGKLVGIITETDLFNIFLEMLGGRTTGVRLTVDLADTPGEIHKLTGAITELRGNIVGMGVIRGEVDTRHITIKVTGVDLEALRQAVKPLVIRLVDIRIE